MTKQCLNHSCTKEWELFGVGDLYLLETHTSKEGRHKITYFWLCSDCARDFDVQLEECGLVSVCPRSAARVGRIPSPEFDLRLVMRGNREVALRSPQSSQSREIAA